MFDRSFDSAKIAIIGLGYVGRTKLCFGLKVIEIDMFGTA